MRTSLLYVAAAAALSAALIWYYLYYAVPQSRPTAKPTIVVWSPAFSNNSSMPAKYTCDGEDLSPPLNWSGVPPGAKAVVVAVIDIDAPGGAFVHWVLYNVPPTLAGLPEGVPKGPATRFGLQAVNDFGFAGYGGPCPPPGRPHRYVFYVIALNSTIDLPGGASAAVALSEARARAIAYGEIVGLYGRG